jgi:hypothetical protein
MEVHSGQWTEEAAYHIRSGAFVFQRKLDTACYGLASLFGLLQTLRFLLFYIRHVIIIPFQFPHPAASSSIDLYTSIVSLKIQDNPMALIPSRSEIQKL